MFQKRFTAPTYLLALLTGLVLLAGCIAPVASPAPSTANPAPAASAANAQTGRTVYPLTITGCGGHTSTFKAAPKTTVTLDAQAYELMFWLGLGQQQIAAGPQPLPAVPDQFKEQTKTVKTIAKGDTAYPAKEALIAAQPDFVYGSYQSGFNGETVFSEDEWAAKGVNTYWSLGIGGCQGDATAVRTDLASVLKDIENLGQIFDIQERASALINQLKSDLETAKTAVGNGPQLRVATFEPGEYSDGKPGVYGAKSTVNAIITLAGGVNAFADLPDAYVQSNWEEYIKRDPEEILIIAYPAAVPQAWEDGEKLLSEMPALQNVPAVKNKRFVRVTFPEVGAGGVRNVEAVKKLAKALAETTGAH